MSEEKILNRLSSFWRRLIKEGYEEKQILGVWLYESYIPENENIDGMAIILPTFKDFCLSNSQIKQKYYVNNKCLLVRDIRSIYNELKEQNINYIKILFEEHFILNKEYEELFNKYFIENNEIIAHYDKQKILKNNSTLILYLLNKETIDNEDLYDANKIYYFLMHYFGEKPFIECVHPYDENLWKLINEDGTPFGVDAETQFKYAKNLEQVTKKLVNEYSNSKSPRHDEAETALNNGVIEILKTSFRKDINISITTKEDFFDKLTVMETKAYYAIVSQIHDKGTISISEIVDKTSISRPVFTNLFVKMKQCDVANIINKGAKGTYIEITLPELKREAINLTYIP